MRKYLTILEVAQTKFIRFLPDYKLNFKKSIPCMLCYVFATLVWGIKMLNFKQAKIKSA